MLEGCVILKAAERVWNSCSALAGGTVFKAIVRVTFTGCGKLSRLSITMAVKLSLALAKGGALTPIGILVTNGAVGSSCGRISTFACKFFPSQDWGKHISVILVGEVAMIGCYFIYDNG